MKELEQKFEKAWEEFWKYFEKKKYPYLGFPKHCQKRFRKAEYCWMGPYFWSEQDIVLHLSRFCMKQFGEYWIHNNAKVAKDFFADVSEKERCYPDIAINNPKKYKNIVVYRNHRYVAKRGNIRRAKENPYEIFAEVKWITKGMWSNDIKKKKEGIKKDCRKLQKQVQKERCKCAFMCIIDDEPEESEIERRLEKWEKTHPNVKILYKKGHDRVELL